MLLPDSTTIASACDGAGRVTSLTRARGTTRAQSVGTPEGNWLTFGYDGFLPTTETATGLAPGVVSRTYDNDFRVATSIVNGSAVSYQYDADSLLTGAGALAISRESATGRVSSTSLGVTATSNTYSEYGELSGFSASAGGTTPYFYSLTRDLAGRITGKTETVQGATDRYGYVYDDAGRLATVTKNGSQTASYYYDANGNRVSATTGAGTVSGTYDDQDRMTGYGSASYTYGPSGDLRTRTAGGQTTTYSYDALGNLLGAWLPDGRTVEYVIDGLNRRVGKKVGGQLREGFLYQGQLRPVAWLDGAGQVYATFVYGLHVNVPEYMINASGTFRIVTDHLGSPRLIVNTSTGAIAQRMDYDEWGQVLQDTNPGFQPFGFAGGIYDRDTGLVRFGARDYDAVMGRWTTKDRSRFRGGLNFYEYAGGNPINFIDPRGKMILPADPSGLPSDWVLDPSHRDLNGSLWRHPSGDSLEFTKGRPGKPRWRGRDHWHHNGDHEDHLKPGDEVPDPAPQCGEPVPDTDPTGDPLEDIEDEMEFSPPPPEVVVPIAITAVIIEILKDAGVIIIAF